MPNGEKMETVTDLILGSPKITAGGDCNHEIKRHLLFGSKAVTNVDSILKSRDIVLLTKVCLVKAMFSSSLVWMWNLDCKEGWVSKYWCWRILLRVPWTARRSNQSILKEIKWIFIGRTYAEAEHFGHLMQRTNSLESTLMLEKNW